MITSFVLALALQTQGADSLAAVDRLFSGFTNVVSPGCAVGVSRGGKTIASRAYGMANLEFDVPNSPNTIFEAGSVSKQFTAAAVALLALDGKLSLEDPIRKYFPELRDHGTPVTIRQMLNHTSGMRDWGVVASAEGWPRGSRVHTHTHVLDIIARQKSLNFTPGSEYLYSNSNYNLAAMLVERVSGMTFAEFTRTRLFVPLGMTSTSWRDDYTRIVKGRATGYATAGGGVWRHDMPFENVHGNGGLLTTVADLLKWNDNFVTPTVGGARFAADMQTRGRLTSGREISYALGLSVGTYRGVSEVSHDGATAGYRAFLARYPDQQLSVALLCNMGTVNPSAIGHRVAEIFLDGKLAAAPMPAGSGTPLTGEQLQRRVGVYRNLRTGEPSRIVLRDSALQLQRAGRLTPLSESAFTVGTGRAEFFADGKSLRLLYGDDTTLFAREPEWTPSAAELQSYRGTYTSDEAESWFRVGVKDDKLMVTDRYARSVELTPYYKDGFVSSQGVLIVFRRNAAGRVHAASLGLGRVRDLRFTRKP